MAENRRGSEQPPPAGAPGLTAPTLVPLILLFWTNIKPLSSALFPPGAFAPPPGIRGRSCGETIGGKNVKCLMGTAVLLVWLGFCSLVGLISAGASLRSCVFSPCRRWGGLFCRGPAPPACDRDPACWFNWSGVLSIGEASACGNSRSTDSFCFGFLQSFCVTSMQLRGAARAHPRACRKSGRNDVNIICKNKG